jgi:CRISPR-associated protein Cmr3
MSVEYRFLEPLDVLFLRGNKLFGDPGSYGEALIPPWPSVAAGAIRSRMLADGKADLTNPATWPPELGTPDNPGPFMVTGFHLARRHGDGRVEALFQVPADLVLSEGADGMPSVRALSPTPLPLAGEGLQSSAPLPHLPVLAETERSKPAGGYWLTQAGWAKYLDGKVPSAADLVKTSALWQIDARVGVGLDAATHRAADGRLFSVQAVTPVKQGHPIPASSATGKTAQADYDVGFLAAVAGARPPATGMVRLGGDGRAAAISVATATPPEPDYETLIRARRCRLVLASPGLFAQGWLPTGFFPSTPEEEQCAGEFRFDLHGVKGRLVCAAVARADVVSGWDLATKAPKSALRAAPAGSVYWLDELETTPESLRKLASHGLWNAPCEDASRRAEGFNRVWLAAWK